MTLRRNALPLLACLVLAACEDPRAARMLAMNQFVGYSEQILIEHLGIPTRTYETDGVKYLAYDERRTDIIPPPPIFNPWFAPAMPAQVIERWCETTFQVSGGLVRSFTLRGNSCG